MLREALIFSAHLDPSSIDSLMLYIYVQSATLRICPWQSGGAEAWGRFLFPECYQQWAAASRLRTALQVSVHSVSAGAEALGGCTDAAFCLQGLPESGTRVAA